MERDAMISHGTSRFLKERLFDMSDPYQIVICDNCGCITSANAECRACKSDVFSRVNFAFSSKLLLTELNAMGIKTVIKVAKY